ncbi:MAG TPA: protein kinase, partial [Bacteroidales bacterium]|nr:protein kinase [Bacteroidales bacterium]
YKKNTKFTHKNNIFDSDDKNTKIINVYYKMLISLRGKYDTYEFDLSQESHIIQKGQKFSSLYRGKRISDNSYVCVKHLHDTQCVQNSEHAHLIFITLTSIEKLDDAIIRTYDIIETEQGYFIVYEYLHGVTIKTITNTPDYPDLTTSKFACKVGIEVCKILKKLHEHGIVHRNIKPSNIFLETDDSGRISPDNPRVRLIDFEIASVHGSNIFSLNKVPFSVLYSPPEQVLYFSHLIDERSDLYSLALVVYEIATRRPSFYHENAAMLINLQINTSIQKNPRISKELFTLLLQATSKHRFSLPPNKYSQEQLEAFLDTGRSQRFQNAHDFSLALSEVFRHLNQPKTRKSRKSFFL